MHDTESVRNIRIIICQYSVCEQRNRTISNLFLNRFQKPDSYRESQTAIGETEVRSGYLDQLALEDKSYKATRRERQRYENIWKRLTDGQKGTTSSRP